MGEVWIIDAVRTPRGKGKKDVGALANTHPQALLATTLRALAERNYRAAVASAFSGCRQTAGLAQALGLRAAQRTGR